MTLVGERMLDVVEVIRSQLISGMREVAAFVEQVERTDPAKVSFSVPLEFATLHKQVVQTSKHLAKYNILFPEISEMVGKSDQFTETMGRRFMKWTEGKQEPETITVTEAMVVFQRSRSTIYRWIKNGRLNAFKQGRLWHIAL